MKSRRYLNVGPLHKAQPGEFFDWIVSDWYIETELGKWPDRSGATDTGSKNPKIIEVPKS